eukprot:10099610-Lingulodinium_polyedra.AAC.1
MLWALQARPGQMLPRVGLMPDDVQTWAVNLANTPPFFLRSWRPGYDGKVDWHMEVGAFTLVEKGGKISAIRHNRSEVAKDLEPQFHCDASDVGEK